MGKRDGGGRVGTGTGADKENMQAIAVSHLLTNSSCAREICREMY